jgi:hypothetical protein
LSRGSAFSLGRGPIGGSGGGEHGSVQRGGYALPALRASVERGSLGRSSTLAAAAAAAVAAEASSVHVEIVGHDGVAIDAGRLLPSDVGGSNLSLGWTGDLSPSAGIGVGVGVGVGVGGGIGRSTGAFGGGGGGLPKSTCAPGTLSLSRRSYSGDPQGRGILDATAADILRAKTRVFSAPQRKYLGTAL